MTDDAETIETGTKQGGEINATSTKRADKSSRRHKNSSHAHRLPPDKKSPAITQSTHTTPSGSDQSVVSGPTKSTIVSGNNLMTPVPEHVKSRSNSTTSYKASTKGGTPFVHTYSTRSKGSAVQSSSLDPTASVFIASTTQSSHRDMETTTNPTTDVADQLANLSLKVKPPGPSTPKKPKNKMLPASTISSSPNFTPRGSSRRPPPAEVLAIPHPTKEYLDYCASAPPSPCPPRRLLVILDINGTLGHRSTASTMRPRPHLEAFLAYLFREHDVMIWTSMTRGNVDKVLAQNMSAEQRASLKLVWTREDMDLGSNFANRVQTYKELKKVWSSTTTRHEMGSYGVTNTLLVDDSFKKAVSEPFNHVVIGEWEGPSRGAGMQDVELLRVRDLIEELRTGDCVARGLYRRGQQTVSLPAVDTVGVAIGSVGS